MGDIGNELNCNQVASIKKQLAYVLEYYLAPQFVLLKTKQLELTCSNLLGSYARMDTYSWTNNHDPSNMTENTKSFSRSELSRVYRPVQQQFLAYRRAQPLREGMVFRHNHLPCHRLRRMISWSWNGTGKRLIAMPSYPPVWSGKGRWFLTDGYTVLFSVLHFIMYIIIDN